MYYPLEDKGRKTSTIWTMDTKTHMEFYATSARIPELYLLKDAIVTSLRTMKRWLQRQRQRRPWGSENNATIIIWPASVGPVDEKRLPYASTSMSTAMAAEVRSIISHVHEAMSTPLVHRLYWKASSFVSVEHRRSVNAFTAILKAPSAHLIIIVITTTAAAATTLLGQCKHRRIHKELAKRQPWDMQNRAYAGTTEGHCYYNYYILLLVLRDIEQRRG